MVVSVYHSWQFNFHKDKESKYLIPYPSKVSVFFSMYLDSTRIPVIVVNETNIRWSKDDQIKGKINISMIPMERV